MNDLSGFEPAKYDPESEAAGVRKAAFAAAISIQTNTPKRSSAAVEYSINAMREYVGAVTLRDATHSEMQVNTSRLTQQRMIATIGWSEVSSDASALEGGAEVAELAQSPLWDGPLPNKLLEGVSLLLSTLRARKEDWEVWLDWYAARMVGDRAVEEWEVERVLIGNEIWEQGPKVANARIGHLPIRHLSKSLADAQLLSVPAQLPAALEPYWDKSQLKIPAKPAKADLNKKKFWAALASLGAEMRNLANDLGDEANIDQRPVEYLKRLADRIPHSMPAQEELFRLGHAESVLVGFVKSVDREWPDFLASRYHALLLQFDRTLRQAPLWREFRRNAANETLNADQISASKPLARQAAKALREEEAEDFVNSALPQTLERLAEAAELPPLTDGAPSNVVEVGAELLAADLIESVNNTLKPIAEVALASAGDYSNEFGKGFRKAAKKQGGVDGQKAFKWLRRLAIAGAGGGGSFVGLSQLLAKYPEAFGWLERVLQHISKF